MKKLCLLSLLCSLLSHAEPLSDPSCKRIMTASLVGSAVGGAVCTLATYLHDGSLKHLSPAWTAASAAVGALTFGVIAASYTPESYLDWADERLQELQHETAFGIALDNTFAVDRLKALYLKNPFPLYKAFLKLTEYYDSLKEIKEAYQVVADSYLKDDFFYALSRIELVERLQQSIAYTIDHIKSQSDFSAQATGYFEQQAAFAQQQQQTAFNAAFCACGPCWYSYPGQNAGNVYFGYPYTSYHYCCC